jgi:O-antigen ligase
VLFVVFTAGVFSYLPIAALNPLGRITLLFLYFLAMYRLSARVTVAWSLNWFFWLAIAHSLLVVVPFLASGGALRSYGLAPVQISMLALVMATAKYLWAKKSKSWIYLCAMVLIFFALLAAQFRSLIIVGVGVSLLVVYFSRLRAKRETINNSNDSSAATRATLWRVRKRPLYLFAGILLSIALAVALYPQLLAPLLERFEILLSAKPSGSILMRITLWKQAWAQFAANPWVGIGPGLYIQIESVDPTIRLNFYHWFVRGLSAHNLLLHYLAEAGIIGGIAVLAMMLNQLHLSFKSWKRSVLLPNLEVSSILLGISITFIVTTLTESSWLWGQASLVFSFFLALIARNYYNLYHTNNLES